jgi:hypothetical protein
MARRYQVPETVPPIQSGSTHSVTQRPSRECNTALQGTSERLLTPEQLCDIKYFMKWPPVAIAVVAGVALFSIGLRLTDEVTVVVGLLGITAATLGFIAPKQWWLTVLALGLGVGLHNLYPPPPYQPDARDVALYGPPQPLPLPFGLTGNPIAETIAVALILLSFWCVVTGIGVFMRGIGAPERK